MGRRILNDALRAIVNAEKRNKSTVELQPVSTVMSSFLKIMKDRGYIKNFQVFDPHRVGRITVELQGRVTDCRALTYRQDIKAKDIETYRLRNLPTRQWGYVVITTPDDCENLEAQNDYDGSVFSSYYGRQVRTLRLLNDIMDVAKHVA
ncbi:40S RIBOSOMAL PROTEIN S15A [Salix koriyanagi]|uniref:40S RIBOSOMAL PROTEIN S15A n=1 Tax=Salix koriyanagi TaxID=2511006 RepID=A0A9Q0TR61_9ROSI|nr:40S RIBOSOMAL PROTEIN S15A [Salix koriyanagi]